MALRGWESVGDKAQLEVDDNFVHHSIVSDESDIDIAATKTPTRTTEKSLIMASRSARPL